MNALSSIDWDALFGYVVHDYCVLSIACAVSMIALALGMRLRSATEPREDSSSRPSPW